MGWDRSFPRAFLKAQMGAGMPMDAIEKGEILEWTSPFKPMSVAQVEVLGQEGVTAVELCKWPEDAREDLLAKVELRDEALLRAAADRTRAE